jgi:hypothetical protein
LQNFSSGEAVTKNDAYAMPFGYQLALQIKAVEARHDNQARGFREAPGSEEILCEFERS